MTVTLIPQDFFFSHGSPISWIYVSLGAFCESLLKIKDLALSKVDAFLRWIPLSAHPPCVLLYSPVWSSPK
jgi:hypothetical protein